ncbi:hypothetical protein E2C01_073783 [Portunus trituberculatus]|uniref:Uncharacterized protein n=1 Tax=Portunus trituberculatus TaxID=210409 RepID=A0A5B7IBH2_PORTR|nr:hypothetical protein [Portunus trituberculatus]
MPEGAGVILYLYASPSPTSLHLLFSLLTATDSSSSSSHSYLLPFHIPFIITLLPSPPLLHTRPRSPHLPPLAPPLPPPPPPASTPSPPRSSARHTNCQQTTARNPITNFTSKDDPVSFTRDNLANNSYSALDTGKRSRKFFLTRYRKTEIDYIIGKGNSSSGMG